MVLNERGCLKEEFLQGNSKKRKSFTCQSRTHCQQENNQNNTSVYPRGCEPKSFTQY